VGVMEMGQRAAVIPHGPGQAQDRPEVRLSLHPERQDRKPFRGGLFMKGRIRLDDETERVSPLPEVAGQEEDLALAAPPFPPGVNLKKAQCALPSSRSRGAWRSG